MATLNSQAAERSEFRDPETGRRVMRWTSSPAKDQHLYFTSHSVTKDGAHLLFVSERSGSPNLHVIDRNSGAIRQLSHADAMLRAYCYPSGGMRGFSKATPYLDVERNLAYWVQDDRAWRCSLESGGSPEKLADLPAQWYTGFTHVSPDGGTFCVPCADPRAFHEQDATQHDQLQRVPWRMIESGLVTRLCMIDTRTGGIRDEVEIPFWVTHVQFDPKGTGRLVFNCEGAAGNRKFPYWGRIWKLDTDGSWSRLFEEAEGEWVCHENWSPDGESLVYHGYHRGEPFIAGRNWDGELLFEYSTEGADAYHAITTPDPHRFTTDSEDGYVHLYDFHQAPGQRDLRLCRHNTSYTTQDEHAHPIMNPDRRGVVFTSDAAGTCDVYEAVL
ncbi:MAG: oligogalacturonate lyase family protein [Phycisphaeraceae bacterium]